MAKINPVTHSNFLRRRLALAALLLTGLLLSVAIVVSKNQHLREPVGRTQPDEQAGPFKITEEDHVQAQTEGDARADEARAAAASPLHWAIQANDHFAFVNALDDVGNLTARDPSGNTALHEAVVQQRLAYSVALLLMGADPHAQNAAGKSPYYALVARERGGMVVDRFRRLLDHTFTGSSPEQRKRQATFVVAVEYDDLNLLARVTDLGVMVDEPWGPDGDAALHHVASALAVEQLTLAGANINAQDRAGTTPLIAAVNAGDERIASRLIQAGAEVDLRDHKGRSALTWAIQNSRSSLSPAMEVLLSNDSEVGLNEWRAAIMLKNSRALGVLFQHGATFSVNSSDGEQVRKWAQMHGGPQVAEALNDHPTIGPDLRRRAEEQSLERDEDIGRVSAIIAPHLAVFTVFLIVVPLLFGLILRRATSRWLVVWPGTLIGSMLATYLAFFPLDVQEAVAAVRWAGTPIGGLLLVTEAIALAASALSALAVLVLLAAIGRAKPTDSRRRSVPVLALSAGVFLVLALHHFERIELLDRSYFAIVGDPAEAVASSGLFRPPKKQPPAPLPAQPAEPWIDRIDHEDFAEVESALMSGADPNARNRAGSTALHLAVGDRNSPMVELLLGYGADPELRDKRGNTALNVTLNDGNPKARLEVVSLLLRAGANVNAADFEHVLPLCRLFDRERPDSDHAAVTAVADLLLDAGAIVNHDGCAPLHYLRAPERVQWLLAKGAELEAKARLRRPSRTHYGKITPLWNAVYIPDISLTETFLLAGANINAQDSITGHTPLYVALARVRYQSPPKPEDSSMIELLLSNGADPSIVAYDGTTAMDIDDHQIIQRNSE